jgi:hypothetical protein
MFKILPTVGQKDSSGEQEGHRGQEQDSAAGNTFDTGNLY